MEGIQAEKKPGCATEETTAKPDILHRLQSMETVKHRVDALHATSGFDYMRLFLAMGIICFHSVAVSYGPHAEDLVIWGGPLKGLARILLCMFFALSGFLVTGSIFRTPFVSGFIALRALRLMPALAIEVTLSAVILGGLLTTMPAALYFHDTQFWSYFLNILGNPHFSLPGVFLSNPLADNVNSNIWTIPVELRCYAFIILLMIFRLMQKRRFLLAVILCATILSYSAYPPLPDNVGPVQGRTLMLCCFWGMIIYLYNEKIWLNAIALCVCLSMALLLLRSLDTAYLATPFIAYATIYLGLRNPRKLPIVSTGDYSYGMYLYGLPIQQAVSFLLPEHRHWWLNILIALPATFLLAACSWHGIEKHALRLKHKISDRNGFLIRMENRFGKMLKKYDNA